MASSIVGAVLLTSLLLGGITFTMWRQSLRTDLRERMHDLAATAALMVDPVLHHGLNKAVDMETETYKLLRERLRQVRAASPDIHFLYTYRWIPGESKPRFVLDTGNQGVDFSALGEECSNLTSTLQASFEKPYRVQIEPDFYTDQWGTWLSAFAPIIDNKGQLEGVLGLDMGAGDIIAQENQLLLMVGGITLAIIIIMALISWLIAQRIARPLLILSQDMGRIQELKLEADIDIHTNIREVALMHTALDNMKMGLRSFRKYVPADLVSQLISLRQEAVLGTSKQELTIFFCDLENFTTASELLSSEDLNHLLTDYFQTITQILQKHGATVDKYIGDAVMAFWNAPIALADHQLCGARAALEIRLELDKRQIEWAKQGLPSLSTRIGLNTGTVLVGNVGHEERLSYTALGDAVNLASRLESLNKYYGTLLLVGEETLQAIGDRMVWRRVDRVAVKGKSKGTLIGEIVNERPAWWTDYEAAWQAYESADWNRALHLFEQVKRPEGEDGPSRVLAERCRRFIERGVPADWTGTWVMQAK